MNWKVFFTSLGMAALSGGATALAGVAIWPDKASLKSALIMFGMGALVGVLNYLKQSPLGKGDGK